MMNAKFHLPGLFEFYEFYKEFLPVYYGHREFFYPWARIASVYGAPTGCLWAGGRLEYGITRAEDVLNLMETYGISARLTFSNSLLTKEHLADSECNRLCKLFEERGTVVRNGVIVHSDLLVKYLRERYPGLYLVSSTTKVLVSFEALCTELDREEFEYAVPDFRLNHNPNLLTELTDAQKRKVEFLVNECCDIGCRERRECYENVSQRALDEDCLEHICHAPGGREGYRFSKAMKNPAFISVEDIEKTYLPAGFTNFKIEGRSLGSALILEFLLYYLTKPEHQLEVRELIYLDSELDLF